MTGLDYAGFALLIFVAGALSTYLFGKLRDAVIYGLYAVGQFLSLQESRELNDRLDEITKLFHEERLECYDLCKQIGSLKTELDMKQRIIRDLEDQIVVLKVAQFAKVMKAMENT